MQLPPCPALPPVPVCLRAWARNGGVHHARAGPIGTSCKRKAGIGLLSGCIVPTPAPSLASASLRYQQPLYTLLPLL